MDLTPNPAAAGFDGERLARIDDHFCRSATSRPGKIAGCQVLVARHGHVAHRATLGYMDLDSGMPLATTRRSGASTR